MKKQIDMKRTEIKKRIDHSGKSAILFRGAEEGNRTPDLLITNQLRYHLCHFSLRFQLSYHNTMNGFWQSFIFNL